jgi:hypothetical protein
MLSTINLIDINEIPIEWIFEYYLNLKEKLDGQDVKLFSVFKSEKTPSMFIYLDLESFEYKFKDFSSGYQGDSIVLVKYLFNIEYHESIYKIQNDYEEFIKYNTSYVAPKLQIHDRFKVTDFQIRHWNNLDQAFWTKFQIGSKVLNTYNVAPLEYFVMTKMEQDGTETKIVTKRNYLYGYFRNDGSLYKIYLPHTPDKKFVKVDNYIQGTEQLIGKDYLIIVSSLKDLMAFSKLNLPNIEAIAPDSENVMIPENALQKLIDTHKYKKLIVLFDNDDSGIKAMQRYKSRYDLDYINLPLEKDLSDSVKEYGIETVRKILLQLIKQII